MIEPQNDETTRSDSRHERANQVVDGQLHSLTANMNCRSDVHFLDEQARSRKAS